MTYQPIVDPPQHSQQVVYSSSPAPQLHQEHQILPIVSQGECLGNVQANTLVVSAKLETEAMSRGLTQRNGKDHVLRT
jgi:hypothetical protein